MGDVRFDVCARIRGECIKNLSGDYTVNASRGRDCPWFGERGHREDGLEHVGVGGGHPVKLGVPQSGDETGNGGEKSRVDNGCCFFGVLTVRRDEERKHAVPWLAHRDVLVRRIKSEFHVLWWDTCLREVSFCDG